jgi:hypothetical protein
MFLNPRCFGAIMTYTMPPEVFDRYTVTRVFRDEVPLDEILRNREISIFPGYTPKGMLRITPTGKPVVQSNPREEIYADETRTFIPVVGPIERMEKYEQMIPFWIENCVGTLPQYAGHNVAFGEYCFGGSREAAISRFKTFERTLAEVLAGGAAIARGDNEYRETAELLFPDLTPQGYKGIAEMMKHTVDIVFGSCRKVRKHFTESLGVPDKAFKAFPNPYLGFQFIDIADGKFILNLDYTHGSQDAEIMNMLAFIIRSHALHTRWPTDKRDKVELSSLTFGKAGAISPELGIGSVVVPRTYLSEGGLIPFPNSLARYFPECPTCNMLTVDSVVYQTVEELEEARELGADAIDEKTRKRVSMVAMTNAALIGNVHVTMGSVLRISDKPLEGITLADEIQNPEADLRMLKGILEHAKDRI